MRLNQHQIKLLQRAYEVANPEARILLQLLIEELPRKGVSMSFVVRSWGDYRINAIKTIREHTGFVLREAKDATDRTPFDIRELPASDYDALRAALKRQGVLFE